MRRREQIPPSSIRCSQQQTTGTSYLLTTASSQHAVREFCQLSNDCSVQNTSSTVNDSIKLRRVQFTSDDEKPTSARHKTSNKPQLFDIQPLVAAEHEETVNEDFEEDSGGRNDYLWSSVAEESILICELESRRSTYAYFINQWCSLLLKTHPKRRNAFQPYN